MPIIESKSKLQLAREGLQEVIHRFGFDIMQQVVTETHLHPGSAASDTDRLVILEEACTYFLTSVTYNEYSTDSKKTSKSELLQYSSFVIKLMGTNASLRDAANFQVISAYLKRYVGTNTIVKKRAFLRTFLRVTLGHFFHETIDEYKKLLPLKPVRDDEPRAFRKMQLAEIINLAQLSNDGQRNHAIIWCFLGSGIRLKELCKLQIKDVLTLEQQIKVYPKMREGRKEKRTMSSLAMLILTDYIDFKYSYLRQTLSPTDYQDLYVFSNDYGKSHLQPRTVQYMVKGLVNQAVTIDDKDRYSVHSFRHSFALYALESGIDIYLISKMLGHRSIGTTDEYLKLFDDQLRDVIDKNPIASEEMRKLQERMDSLCQNNC